MCHNTHYFTKRARQLLSQRPKNAWPKAKKAWLKGKKAKSKKWRMELTSNHGIGMNSWYRHGLVAKTWTHGI